MEIDFHSWLSLLIRWLHVIFGVAWIGQTYLFNWMESNFIPDPEDKRKNIAGRLWMVHGGGFYLVEKQKEPEIMPSTLHWFKWESAFTWLTGITLLVLVYYQGGLMLDGESNLSDGTAILISVGTLILGWVVYDSIMMSDLGKHPLGVGILFYALTMLVAYGLSRFLSIRAAYFHVGALFGTIMAANVWMRILPGQTKMIEAVKAGKQPDMSQGARAKLRSRQNSFMSIPLILIMISNHFPITRLWVLGVLILVGWGAAKLFVVAKTPKTSPFLAKDENEAFNVLQCKQCGEVFRIGEDSNLVTDKDIFESVLQAGGKVVSHGHPKREPDLVLKQELSSGSPDSDALLQSKKEEVAKLKRIREKVDRGIDLYWCCGTCRAVHPYRM